MLKKPGNNDIGDGKKPKPSFSFETLMLGNNVTNNEPDTTQWHSSGPDHIL